MNENNSFLSNYGKDERQDKPQDKPQDENQSVAQDENQGEAQDTPQDKAQITVDAPKTYKYEQKSGFKKPERKDDAPPVSGGGKSKLTIGLITGGVLLVVAVLLIVLLSGGGVLLPDFVGENWALSQVQVWARENSVLIQTEQVHSDAIDADRIIAQDKEPGTRIGSGEYVRVTVSLGPDLTVTLQLPDIMSMTMQQIEEWAAQNFLSRVRFATEFDETVPSGGVIRFEVNDDSVVGGIVRRDSPIYIIISKGPESEAATITVPDFKTKSMAEAYAFANENGITLTIKEEFDDYVPAGVVISQSVKADEKVSRGSEITLVISKGPMVTVPSFKSYSKENAMALASSLGIPITITERYSGSSAGAFLSQSIAAGSIYESGDFLELAYSLGNRIIIPSFVGQTQDAIESWAQALNEQGASIKIKKAADTYSSMPKGSIITQTPSNESKGIKTTITITLSLGKVVYVPDFISGAKDPDHAYTVEEALAVCEQIGLIPIFEQKAEAGVLPGVVWYQSIAAGAEKPEGTVITLYYQPGKPNV